MKIVFDAPISTDLTPIMFQDYKVSVICDLTVYDGEIIAWDIIQSKITVDVPKMKTPLIDKTIQILPRMKPLACISEYELIKEEPSCLTQKS